MSRKFYGSANNQTALVKKFYGGVNNEATEAVKLYGPLADPILNGNVRSGSVNIVSFNAETFRAKMKSAHPELWTDLEDVRYVGVMVSYVSGSYYVSLSWGLKQGATILESFLTPAATADYGIGLTSGTYTTAVNDYIDLSLGYTSTAKLIHQGFGHLEYSGSLWGDVSYYTGVTYGYGAGPNSKDIDVRNIDQQGAARFISEQNVKITDHTATLWFDSSDRWSFERNDGNWNRLPRSYLQGEYGLEVYPMGSSARFDLVDNAVIGVDTSSTVATVSLLSNAEYNSLVNSNGVETKTATVGGQSIIMAQIKGYVGGVAIDEVPNYFLSSASHLESVDFSHSPIQTIGNFFLQQTPLQTLVLPDTVTSIGDYFLYYCSTFNGNVNISNVSSIGTYFMGYCQAFNRPLNISHLTTLPNAFMTNCFQFNQPLDLSNVTAINADFLRECRSYNQNLNFHAGMEIGKGTSGIGYFLYNCYNYTATITFETEPPSGISSTSVMTTTATGKACYTTGITVTGTWAAAWSQVYPNRDANPYRKLLFAGASEQYGIVYHYGYNEEYISSGWTQNVTWQVVDMEKTKDWVSTHNYGYYNIDQLSFWYQNGTWNYWLQSQQGTVSDMLSEVGISVTSTKGGFQDNDGFSIRYSVAVDTSTGILQTHCQSVADFNKMSSGNSSGSVYALDSRNVYSKAVVQVVVGTDITALPNSFLYCSTVKSVYFATPANFTTIGNNILYGCSSLYTPVRLDSATSVGTSFLNGCTSFNTQVSLNSATTIGDTFMYGCKKFNQSISFPEVTAITNQFLRGCTSFNSSVSLPKLTTLGAFFLMECTSYNLSLSFSNLTSIGNGFLDGCTSFNRSISITKVQSIANQFLYGCTAYNTSLSLPTTLTSIGTYFMYGCTSFNKNISIPSSVTAIGTYFFYCCNAMVSTITLNCQATVASTSNYTFATTSNTAACYTTGIKLAGSYKSNWQSRFPNRTSSPYRKTVV